MAKKTYTATVEIEANDIGEAWQGLAHGVPAGLGEAEKEQAQEYGVTAVSITPDDTDDFEAIRFVIEGVE